MSKKEHLTESKFNAIKILLKGGATIREAADYMQVGYSTVSRVKQAETWEEYLQQTAARTLAAREHAAKKNANNAPQVAPMAKPAEQPAATVQKVIHEQSITIQATHYMMEEMRKVNATLECISRKLAAIVEDLYGTKEG